MKKRKFLLSLPLLIIAGFLIYCWTIFLSTSFLATWRHYVALCLFISLIFLYFKNFNLAIIGTGLYLLLATFNALSITTDITVSWMRIGPIETPPIQLLSLGLFILYLILSFDALTDIYLDYKEAKDETKSK